jgi:hypothetical protein
MCTGNCARLIVELIGPMGAERRSVARVQLILSLLRVPLAVTLGGADRERCALACAIAIVSNSINQLADVYNLAVTSRS